MNGQGAQPPALDEQLLARYHDALGQLINGNPDGYKSLFSRGEDVTLANPFGPAVRGWASVERTVDRAAANYAGGRVSGFEEVSRYETTELAYLVEMERFEARVGEAPEPSPVALRVTSIFRPEDGTWKLVHRHADPITSQRAPESVIARQ